MLSLKHTIYNFITYLRSIKLTYTRTLQKQQTYSTNKRQKTERFNFISLALNSKKILKQDLTIERTLANYVFSANKSVKNHSIFSKYLQSSLYTYKQQKSLYLKIYIDKKTETKYPISIISLNIVYIVYRLMISKPSCGP